MQKTKKNKGERPTLAALIERLQAYADAPGFKNAEIEFNGSLIIRGSRSVEIHAGGNELIADRIGNEPV